MPRIPAMKHQPRKPAANWLALALGITVSIAMAALVVKMRPRPKLVASKVTIGTNDTVFYSRGENRADATNLGQALRNTGFFRDQGASVLLSKNKGVSAISFVLNDGGWNHPATVAGFEEIARRVAPAIGGYPLEVRLVDSGWTVHKSVEIGKVTIGTRDAVYYSGSATENDAQALGQALRAAGYLEDRGATVVLSKDDGTAIGFVVNAGVWDYPEAVAGFEDLVRRVAPSVGGLPIQLRLLDSLMETKKVARVN